MVVTFKSRATGEFSMLGNEAVRRIKMMGRSGTVPGALSADEVSAALKQLKVAIAAEKEAEEAEEAEEVEEKEDDKEPHVNISVRAYPLIEMLTAAVRENCEVMWY
jgi:hypothetical protein